MELEYKWMFHLPLSCRLPGEGGVTHCIMSEAVYRFHFKILQPVENLHYFIPTIFFTTTAMWHQDYVYQIEKMLQLLGDFVPQTPYQGFAPGPHWGTSVPETP